MIINTPKTREEAEELLAEFARLDSRIARITRSAEEAQTRIRQRAADSAATMGACRAEIEGVLKKWFKKEEKSLGGARSVKLPSGNLGFRDGTPRIEFLADWDDEISLKAMQRSEKWEAYIRRGKDSIDKPALLKATELHGDPLARVGMKIGKKKDEFFIDPNVSDTKERAA